jgi:hypothetical protein
MAQLDVGAQVEGETREGRARTGAGKQRKKHRTRCKETGHISRTCKKDVVELSE